MSWEQIIGDSLKDLDDFLKNDDWFGRENEIINLFAHRFLLVQLGKGPFIEQSQIGIEVAVKQLRNQGKKKLVRKDLVLWEKPGQNVWRNQLIMNNPKVILEWKTNNIAACRVDIDWLKAYTKLFPQVLGYSICAFIKKERGISYTIIKKGKVQSIHVF